MAFGRSHIACHRAGENMSIYPEKCLGWGSLTGRSPTSLFYMAQSSLPSITCIPPHSALGKVLGGLYIALIPCLLLLLRPYSFTLCSFIWFSNQSLLRAGPTSPPPDTLAQQNHRIHNLVTASHVSGFPCTWHESCFWVTLWPAT